MIKNCFFIVVMFTSIVNAKAVAHWRMNDNAANTTVNDSANSYNGDSQQNTEDIDTTGIVGGALTFNGSSDYIDTGDTFQSTFRDSFSMNFWVKPTDGQPLSNEWFLSVWQQPSNAYALEIVLISGGRINILYYVNWNEFSPSTGLISVATDDAVFPNGETSWTMLTFVVEKLSETTARALIYIDGVLTKTGESTTISIGDYISTDNIHIGLSEETMTGFFEGTFDNYTIWNEALPAVKIKRLYNGGNGTEMLGEIDDNHRPHRHNNSHLPMRARYEG